MGHLFSPHVVFVRSSNCVSETFFLLKVYSRFACQRLFLSAHFLTSEKSTLVLINASLHRKWWHIHLLWFSPESLCRLFLRHVAFVRTSCSVSETELESFASTSLCVPASFSVRTLSHFRKSTPGLISVFFRRKWHKCYLCRQHGSLLSLQSRELLLSSVPTRFPSARTVAFPNFRKSTSVLRASVSFFQYVSSFLKVYFRSECNGLFLSGHFIISENLLPY